MGEWVWFGWQGISGLVPPEWNLGAIGGDYRQGYLRLDDSDHPRLELKWSQQEVNLSRALEKYLRALGRPRKVLLGRRGLPIVINREVKILSRRAKPSKRMLGFSWRQGHLLGGAGLIWACQSCGRTLIGQVRAYGGEDAVSLAEEIFSHLEDHGKEGWLLWALYGLECQVPQEYHLTGQSLMAGYLELSFQKNRRKLRIGRWGLAASLLEKQSLREWFEKRMTALKRDFRWQACAIIIKNHAGLEMEGESRRLLRRLWRGARGLILGSLPADGEGPRQSAAEGKGQMWHCPESNRIYLVESVFRPEPEVLAGVVESVRCHR